MKRPRITQTARTLIRIIGVLTVASSASAQARTGWTLSWENDSFVLGTGSDDLYTNGIRFSLGRPATRNPQWIDTFGNWVGRHGIPGGAQFTSLSFQLGQNFFTPNEITTFIADPTDRPYAGLLYLGAHMDVTENKPNKPDSFTLRFQHSFEANVGVFGQHGFAGETQSAVHVLRQNRIPKGWPNQIKDEPGLFVNYMGRARIGWHFADLVPHAGVMLGTPQTHAYGGATARLGLNLTGFPALLIPQTAGADAQNPDWEIGLLAGFEQRAFVRNGFVEGGLFRDSPSLPKRAAVRDVRAGFTVRLTDWRLSYTFVRRSPEIGGDSGLGRHYHNFGSVTFGFEPGKRTAADREGTRIGRVVDDILSAAFRTFLFEASVGSGHVTGGSPGTDEGMSMHVGIGRRLSATRPILRLIGITGELTGIVQSSPKPALTNADHSDTFLTSKVIAVRVMPFEHVRGLQAFHVRAGIGSASTKLQITPGYAGARTTPCPAGTAFDDDQQRRCNASQSGRGTLLGAGYGLRLGDEVTLNSDLSWNRFANAGARGFVAWTFGVGWHP